MFRTLAFALAASALAIVATPTDPKLHARATNDNIVYVTDANKFWCVPASHAMDGC